MNPRTVWQAAAIATCVAVMGCSRNPQPLPEKTVDSTPAEAPVVSVVPAGEHSDPSLVASTVTASLDANAPWTTPPSDAPQTNASGEGRQSAAPPQDEGPSSAARDSDSGQANAPSEAPASVTSSPQAARESATVDVAKSGEASRTSTN